MSLEDNIGRALYLYDVYEWPTALTVAVLARPGTTYIDVGAHVGSYATLGALAVGPTGRVLAFEPDEANRSRLLRHVGLNRLPNVEVFDHGLGEASANVSMVRPVAANSGMTRAARSGETPDFAMQVRRLDDVIASVSGPRVSVVKIDVEGAEVGVVRGASRLIERDRPFIVFEENDSACGTHLVEHFGYTLFAIGQDGYLDLAQAFTRTRRDQVMAPNVLAVPWGENPPDLPKPAQAWPHLKRRRMI
jgi:FkbM family methyltransferase